MQDANGLCGHTRHNPHMNIVMKRGSRADHIAGNTTLFLCGIETKNQVGDLSRGGLQLSSAPANQIPGPGLGLSYGMFRVLGAQIFSDVFFIHEGT